MRGDAKHNNNTTEQKQMGKGETSEGRLRDSRYEFRYVFVLAGCLGSALAGWRAGLVF